MKKAPTQIKVPAQKIQPVVLEKKERFPIGLSALVCGLAVLTMLAPTLSIPFYQSDDSNSIQKALILLDKIKQGNWLFGLEPIPGERRYFPGFYYYEAFRVALLGLQSFAWHAFHMAGYTLIGILSCWMGWRVTKSIVPGAIALILVISTGAVTPSSNWFNFIALPTFEPPLIFLWASSAFCLVLANDRKSPFGKVALFIAGTFLLFWSIIFKETTFLIVGAVGGALLLLALLRPWAGRDRKIDWYLVGGIGILLAMASGWGLHVYNIVPKDDAYGGMGTLSITPKSVLDGFVAYKDIIVEQSDYLVLLGLVMLAARLAVVRPANWTVRDYWLLVLIFAGLCQILTLTIWPYYEARYVQPAYLCFLLVGACEFWNWFTMKWRRGGQEISKTHYLIAAGMVIGVPLIMRLGMEAALFEKALRYYLVGIGCVAIVISLLSRSGSSIDRISRLGVLVGIVPCLVIVALQSANLQAFIFTEYNVREGIRHKTVRYAARTAAPNGAVYWIVNPDNEGHAWASQMHLELFFDRGDLTVGPSSWVYSQRKPRRGDVLIDYTLNKDGWLQGTGTLSRLDQEARGPTFAAKTTLDIRKLLNLMMFYPSQFSSDMLAIDFQSSRMPIYRVISGTWEPAPAVLQRYFGGSPG